MADNPLPFFTAPDVRVATWMVNKLLEMGIPAEVRPDIPTTTVDPLTGATTMADPTRFEVVVTDPAKLEEARKVLEDQRAEVEARREARAARTGTVSAECEDCGKTSTWPASAMGTTESCPHCTAYMDVPDPDDDWGDLDVGDEDGENG
jgi:hypothetical protein